MSSVSPPAGHRAVIPDIGKVIGAPGRIVLEHRIGTERALMVEGQRAENLGRYTAIEFIERLTRARAVTGQRVAGTGQAVVGDVRLCMSPSWLDCGLMPVERLNTTDQPGKKMLFLATDARGPFARGCSVR